MKFLKLFLRKKMQKKPRMRKKLLLLRRKKNRLPLTQKKNPAPVKIQIHLPLRAQMELHQ